MERLLEAAASLEASCLPPSPSSSPPPPSHSPPPSSPFPPSIPLPFLPPLILFPPLSLPLLPLLLAFPHKAHKVQHLPLVTPFISISLLALHLPHPRPPFFRSIPIFLARILVPELFPTPPLPPHPPLLFLLPLYHPHLHFHPHLRLHWLHLPQSSLKWSRALPFDSHQRYSRLAQKENTKKYPEKLRTRPSPPKKSPSSRPPMIFCLSFP